MWLENEYITRLSSRVRNFKKKSNSLWNFSCPVCGDSRQNPYKARGYLLRDGFNYIFKCHNCSDARSFESLLRHHFPDLYQNYKLDKYKNLNNGKNNEKIVEDEESVKAFYKKSDRLFDRLFDRIDQLPIDNPGVQYVLSRKIPRETWDRLYYIDDISRIKAFNSEKHIKGNEPRLVIPLYSRKGDLCGLTARALTESKMKYIILRLVKGDQLSFGLDRCSFNEDIYVVEGPIDSLFLPNAVASCNADFKGVVSQIPKEKAILILDNQPRNPQIMQQYRYWCDKDVRLFVWPDSFPHKDINDCVSAGMTIDEVLDLIQENTFQGLALKLRLAQWSKYNG